uniref:Uncharacterized protein n=1 Tax=Opuntia streptacantha TaxID=393608 RepID=A0A7C9CQV7_OPUST
MQTQRSNLDYDNVHHHPHSPHHLSQHSKILQRLFLPDRIPHHHPHHLHPCCLLLHGRRHLPHHLHYNHFYPLLGVWACHYKQQHSHPKPCRHTHPLMPGHYPRCSWISLNRYYHGHKPRPPLPPFACFLHHSTGLSQKTPVETYQS